MKIHCTAYPKSGVTWLVRLLSDLLDSPQSGGEILEPIYWGDQGGNHTIVKTHWRVDEYPKGNHKIVVLQRDPRDVAVSAMYYSSLEPTDENLTLVIETMVSTVIGIELIPTRTYQIYHLLGWYEKFIRAWEDSGRYDVFTRYELLSDLNELKRIVYELTGNALTEDRVKESMERQAFENLAPKFPHSMRKGIVGDWRNHFKPIHCEYITEHLGEFMLEQKYIASLEWW
jgi:hypothetical protein